MFLNNRYYDPTLARFTSVDPLAKLDLPQSLNPYTYALGNPVTYSDPSGLCSVNDPMAAQCFAQASMPSQQAFNDAVASAVKAPVGRTQATTRQAARFYECSCQVGDIAAYIVDHGGPLDVASALFDFPEAYLDFTGGGNEPYTQPGGVPRDLRFVLADALQNSLLAGAARMLLGGEGEAATPATGEWEEPSGILRDAARGKGNFGLGESTEEVANRAGQAWVGEGATVASDGKTLVSADGLRQYRPPTFKPNLGLTQANFESRWIAQGRWQTNGHLTIVVRS